MSSLCVTGYASLDYVLHLAQPVVPDQTSHASRVSEAWPRLGGCPTYISKAVAQMDQSAIPVTWLGDDPLGAQFLTELQGAKVSTKGVATIAGAASPTAVMLYQPDGSCACIYDPALTGQEELTEAQKAAIAAASHLCISVGPTHLMRAIMELRSASARLYWAVKNDPACFTPEICEELSKTADVIFCSAAERTMIGPSEAIVVQTMGAKGVQIEAEGRCMTLPVTALDAHDTTGAGDSFAGGYIAADMAGDTNPQKAAQSGIDAAARLLRNRQSGGGT